MGHGLLLKDKNILSCHATGDHDCQMIERGGSAFKVREDEQVLNQTPALGLITIACNLIESQGSGFARAGALKLPSSYLHP
jgi:hypothetical protein